MVTATDHCARAREGILSYDVYALPLLCSNSLAEQRTPLRVVSGFEIGWWYWLILVVGWLYATFLYNKLTIFAALLLRAVFSSELNFLQQIEIVTQSCQGHPWESKEKREKLSERSRRSMLKMNARKKENYGFFFL